MNKFCAICGWFYASVHYSKKYNGEWIVLCEGHEHATNNEIREAKNGRESLKLLDPE